MMASLMAAGRATAEGEPPMPGDTGQAAKNPELQLTQDVSSTAAVSTVSTSAVSRVSTAAVSRVSANAPKKRPSIAAEDAAPSAALPKTGQTESYRTGDDGAHEKGVAWPDPRFTVQADTNCVRDNLTGLIWARNANLEGTKTWDDAVTYCEELNFGGQTDWRLPNRNELTSLIDCGNCNVALPTNHPFAGARAYYYWSATSSAHDTTGAWCVNMGTGVVDGYSKSMSFFVWPVCGGQ